MTTTHIYDGEGADRYRVVVERGARERRPMFEALIPCDASEAEVLGFCAQLADIFRRRRANEQTRKERPPK